MAHWASSRAQITLPAGKSEMRRSKDDAFMSMFSRLTNQQEKPGQKLPDTLY
jgi:hypothetical protein